MSTTNYKALDIAKVLTLTTRRVQQLVKENILPAPIRGKYDLVSCILRNSPAVILLWQAVIRLHRLPADL